MLNKEQVIRFSYFFHASAKRIATEYCYSIEDAFVDTGRADANLAVKLVAYANDSKVIVKDNR